MSDFGWMGLVGLPAALGLLGFIEPCSIGSTLLFIKYLEARPAHVRILETLAFAVARAGFIGGLGLLAVLLGSAFVGVQKSAWIVLGGLYVLLGIALFTGHGARLMVAIGPRIGRVSGARGAVGLGALFGLNIPACAAPLLAALLGAHAARGAMGATLASGFISLGVFGFALSLPLVVAMFSARARHALAALARLGTRAPRWTGVLMIALGLWSIRFGLVAEVPLA
jgi:cytochrome c-type biogenesis protein